MSERVVHETPKPDSTGRRWRTSVEYGRNPQMLIISQSRGIDGGTVFINRGQLEAMIAELVRVDSPKEEETA